MKQHITKKQWDEIGEKQWDFVEAVNPERIDGVEIESQNHAMEVWGRGNPKDLPSIGQMIEFLGEDMEAMCNTGEEWGIAIDSSEPLDPDILKEKELCDALWIAVKVKLENNAKT